MVSEDTSNTANAGHFGNTPIRYDDIDRLKAIAIGFVVLGHVVARYPPVGAEWFWIVKDTLYQFHMAVFMFVSGFLFARKNYTASVETYFRMITQRADRLIVPFLVMGLTVVILKYSVSNMVHVDRPVNDILPALLNIFNVSGPSPVTFIWYLFVLFFYSLVTPLIKRFLFRSVGLLVTAVAALLLADNVTMFFMEYGFKLYIFFVLGDLAWQKRDVYFACLQAAGPLTVVPLLAGVAIYQILLVESYDAHYKSEGLLTIGISAIPFLHYIVSSGPLKSNAFLLNIAKYTFSIYLLNVIVIGGAKEIMKLMIEWNSQNFLIYIAVLFFAGIGGPIIAKKYSFSHVRILDQYTS